MSIISKGLTVVGKMGVGFSTIYLLFVVGVAIDKCTTITLGDIVAMLFLIVGSYLIGTIIFKGLDFLFDKFYKPRLEQNLVDSSSTISQEIHFTEPITDEEAKEQIRWGDDDTFGEDEDEEDFHFYDDFGNPT
jgi:hypothetical protein